MRGPLMILVRRQNLKRLVGFEPTSPHQRHSPIELLDGYPFGLRQFILLDLPIIMHVFNATKIEHHVNDVPSLESIGIS